MDIFEKIKQALVITNEYDIFDYFTVFALRWGNFDDIKTQENKIVLCESETWYSTDNIDSHYVLKCESDSLYIKGIGYIYSDLLYNLNKDALSNLKKELNSFNVINEIDEYIKDICYNILEQRKFGFAHILYNQKKITNKRYKTFQFLENEILKFLIKEGLYQ